MSDTQTVIVKVKEVKSISLLFCQPGSHCMLSFSCSSPGAEAEKRDAEEITSFITNMYQVPV